ncbi:MAG TPA: MerR family transcriptional regulator [Candidatus Nitrosotenuis sp.]|nr:MerR family transcriptional regulator [Candidatus Nitrosotenuis sp.]
MNMETYLALPELVSQARQAGLDVNERTIKFYTARGLLPRPEKNPFAGADGRARYYPADTLKRLRKIHQLKAQGYTLEQVARILEQRQAEPLRQLGAAHEADWRRQVVFRLLAPGADESRRARLEFLAAVMGSREDETLLRATRAYLTRKMAPLVGEREAARHVNEFLLSLSPRDLQRYLEPFRRWRDREEERRQAGSPTPFQALRSLVGNLLLKLAGPDEFLAEIEGIQARLAESAERAAGLSGRDPLLEEHLRRGLQWIREGLETLASGARPARAPVLARGLDRVLQGQAVLGHVAEIARRYAALLEGEGVSTRGPGAPTTP